MGVGILYWGQKVTGMVIGLWMETGLELEAEMVIVTAMEMDMGSW